MLRQQHDTAARRKEKPRRGGEKAHGVCRPGRDTAARRKESPPKATKNVASATGNKTPKAERIAAKGGKGFNWICAKLLFMCADSRFAEPRCSLKKVLIVAVRSCGYGGLNRGLQNLGTPFGKGFNFVCAKPPSRCADSRFAEPRSFLRWRTSCHFLHCAKSNQKAHGAKPCDPRFKALPEVILQSFPAAHVETGFAHKTPAKRL